VGSSAPNSDKRIMYDSVCALSGGNSRSGASNGGSVKGKSLQKSRALHVGEIPQ